MTEQPQRTAGQREEIAVRVANFKATQEKFAREREEFFAATLDNARQSSEPSVLSRAAPAPPIGLP